METFGGRPSFRLNAQRLAGRGRVRAFYEAVLRAFPDLRFEVEHEHVGDRSIVCEVRLAGTHEGPWMGIAPTGRKVNVTNCLVYTFDARGRLAGERVYFDEAGMLRQLGALGSGETRRRAGT
jgi:predicted ester cyclase